MIIFRLFLFSSALSISWFYYDSGLLINFMDAALWLALLVALILQIAAGFKGRLYFGYLRAPIEGQHWLHWLSLLNKWLALAVLHVAYVTATPTVQFSEEAYRQELLGGKALILFLALLALPTRKRVDPLFNLLIAIISLTCVYELYSAHAAPKPDDALVISPPFAESFAILNGGSGRLVNNMVTRNRSSRSHGVHFQISDDGFRPQPAEGSDRPSPFGVTIIAPVAGEVVDALDSLEDYPSTDAMEIDAGPGNFITLKVAEERYVVFTHLKMDSVLVEPGERVEVGQALAQVGKSGQISEPALFMVVFSSGELFDPGTESVPIYLKQVEKIGESTLREFYYPVRNDVFRPLRPQR